MANTIITLRFSKSDFAELFSGWGDAQLENSIRDGVRSGIENSLKLSLGDDMIAAHTDEYIHVGCLKGIQAQDLTLRAIRERGSFDVFGLKARVDVPKGYSCDQLVFVNYEGDLGSNPQPVSTSSTSKKSMKKWDRLGVRLSSFVLPSSLLPIDADTVEQCPCSVRTIKPRPSRVLSFQCFVCGKCYICECFRGIIEKQIARQNYNNTDHQELLNRASYKDAICHLCQGIPVTGYGSNVVRRNLLSYYWEYIRDFSIIKKGDRHAAENYVRDRLNVPRVGEGWLAEANLLRLVRSLFPSFEVIHQASPEWLGRQRLDIYVPHLKLAIEYNGEQHYRAIERFGGEEGFIRTQQRDNEKREKAKGAGVVIIEIRYDEAISAERLLKRIEDELKITLHIELPSQD